MVIALIIAGGSGIRMQKETPKQFIKIYEKPVLVYTLERFQQHTQVDAIEVVCLDGWIETVWTYVSQYNIDKLKYVTVGGRTGQESIRNGVFELEHYFSYDDIVLIHDAVRPMVSAEIISDCIEKTQRYGCGIASVPCMEAMIQTEDGYVSTGNYPREKLKRTQTPQGFKLGELCELHRKALNEGIFNTIASCTLMIELGRQVHFSIGSEKNIKLTTVEDIDIFKALLYARNLE